MMLDLKASRAGVEAPWGGRCRDAALQGTAAKRFVANGSGEGLEKAGITVAASFARVQP